MIDKLLKEDKNPVGRPKLADSIAIKKAKISVLVCLLLCLILIFNLVCIIIKEEPINYAYNLTIGKLTGNIKDSKGLKVKEYYNSSNDYIMDINITDSIDKYSGSYKYTLYYLKNNKWVKDDTKEFLRNTKNISIKIKSKKNENVTWKIKFQIVNSSNIEKSYAPFSWKYVDSKENNEKYIYKVFTVKGYYSPISLSEIKESNKNKDKIRIYTTKENPRILNLNLPDGSFNVKVKYTDMSGKEVILADEKNIENNAVYKIPSLERSTKVTFDIYDNNSSIKDKVLSNWKIIKDKKNKKYATTSYIVKPEKSY